MRFLYILSILFVSPCFAWEKENVTYEKIVQVDDAIIPTDCNSSSDCVVLEQGIFPDSCYVLKKVNVVHVSATLHEVTNTAEVAEGLCLEVILPFEQKVNLGKLLPGEHTIHFMSSDRSFLEKSLLLDH